MKGTLGKSHKELAGLEGLETTGRPVMAAPVRSCACCCAYNCEAVKRRDEEPLALAAAVEATDGEDRGMVDSCDGADVLAADAEDDDAEDEDEEEEDGISASALARSTRRLVRSSILLSRSVSARTSANSRSGLRLGTSP